MLTKEEFVEKLNFHCKIDGKEVWVNIMPLIKTLFDEHEAQLKAKDDEIELLKHRIEEAMKPETCEGCVYKMMEF